MVIHNVWIIASQVIFNGRYQWFAGQFVMRCNKAISLVSTIVSLWVFTLTGDCFPGASFRLLGLRRLYRSTMRLDNVKKSWISIGGVPYFIDEYIAWLVLSLSIQIGIITSCYCFYGDIFVLFLFATLKSVCSFYITRMMYYAKYNV